MGPYKPMRPVTETWPMLFFPIHTTNLHVGSTDYYDNVCYMGSNSKEAENWVREPGNKEMFANAFSKGSHIRDQLYNIVAPRVPLTFEPENTTYLREIEEANGLTPHTMRKAR